MSKINISKSGAWYYNNPHDYVDNQVDKNFIDSIFYFIKEEKILMDFGCGEGIYLKYISTLIKDIELIGIEPYVTNEKYVFNYDLTQPFDLKKKGNILCIEVLEHIPPSLENFVINNIIQHCNNYLFLSWASPKQGGHGHINEKNKDLVIKLFENKGFKYLKEDSENSSRKAKDTCIKNNLCIFKIKYNL
jgi:hypothetical protein